MNHYQRLKVAHDAPAEVIRAAYRALATKLHPDRQGPSTGPDDLLHAEMAALNAAYEALIDPKLRADYDATLAPGAAKASPWVPVHAEPNLGAGFDGGLAHPQGQTHAHAHAHAHAPSDLDWLMPSRAAAPATGWQPDRKVLTMGVVGGLLVLLLGGAGLWRALSHRQMEEALSKQYRDQGGVRGVVGADPSPASPASLEGPTAMADAARASRGAAPAVHKPTVDELARMSDEELLKVLPTLDANNAEPSPGAQTSRAAPAVHHPLDGNPLRLRVESQLVDPLAPEPTRVAGKAAR